jgi:hypothetical protein
MEQPTAVLDIYTNQINSRPVVDLEYNIGHVLMRQSNASSESSQSEDKPAILDLAAAEVTDHVRRLQQECKEKLNGKRSS